MKRNMEEGIALVEELPETQRKIVLKFVLAIGIVRRLSETDIVIADYL